MKRKILAALLSFPFLCFAYSGDDELPAGVINLCEAFCILPSAGPCVSGSHVFFSIDFLYWTARLDGLAFVETGKPSNASTFHEGKAYYPKERFEPGFKAGIGAKFNCDLWDVYANYTYLQIHDTKNSVLASAHPGSALENTWIIQAAGGRENPTTIRSASADWSLKFNILDLELGRNFFVSPRLAFRPFMGAKGVWIAQGYRTRYRGDFLFSEQSFDSKTQHDLDFIGGGLRMGINSSWFLGRYFSIYANTALSEIWGQFEALRKEKQQQNTSAKVTVLNQYNRFHTNKAVLELGAGLRCDIPMFCHRYNLRLQAGWESQCWFSQNQLIRLLEESAHGDLVLHGLTVEGRFDF